MAFIKGLDLNRHPGQYAFSLHPRDRSHSAVETTAHVPVTESSAHFPDSAQPSDARQSAFVRPGRTIVLGSALTSKT